MKYKNEEIVYIEYVNEKPHSVETEYNSYGFEIDCNEEELFMHYNHGGGKTTEVEVPHYVDACKDKASFWLKEDIKLVGIPNIKRLDNPIEIKNSLNPFDNSREVYQLIFCEVCDKWLDEDWCEHIAEDNAGNIIYVEDGRPCE